MPSFPCTLCSGEFSAPSEKLLLTRIRLAHSHDPVFILRMFSNFITYQNHRVKHSQGERASNQDVSEEDDSIETDLNVGGSDQSNDRMCTPTAEAKWILKTRESLTRAAMQGVLDNVQDLISFLTKTLESQTHIILRANGIDPNTLSGLSDVFSGPCT